MNKLLFIFIFAAAAFTAHSQTILTNNGLEVNGLGLDAKYSSITRKLGKPLSVKNGDAEPCVGGKQRTVKYPGLVFELISDQTGEFSGISFEVTSAKWNVSGAKVGWSQAAVKKRFGKPTSTETEANGDLVWYYEMHEEEGPGNSHFVFRKGKVVRIASLYFMC